MVTQERLLDNLLLRYRLGTALIWLGVGTWVPFILLRVVGQRPVFLWFLPFHLAGVIGGSRLRSVARRELGIVPTKRNWLHTAGHGLILFGISVWAPYFYLKLVASQSVDVMSFLPFHLIGVLGGVGLHVLSYLRRRRTERTS